MPDMFRQSIDEQIALNQSRTPTQRFEALCELLDFARAIAPITPEAVERRRRIEAARLAKQEQWREQCRQIIAAQRASADPGI